jgi:heme ABC exporter ATP-binding subunit CcmA
MTQAIELQKVWKFYGDYAALRDCTLSIQEGSCCALLGRNGAGKTTLLRILSGLTTFQRGSVALFGEKPRAEKARQQTGFLGHGIGVYEDLSAQENLHFFARITGSANFRTLTDTWLERVGLARVATMPVRQFSRGMRQRLALARTFIHAPKILLLDEPFGALDEMTRERLNEELLAIRAQQAWTAFFVTHSVAEAVFLSNRILVMSAGPGRIHVEVRVDLPYPRTADTRLSRSYHELVAEVSRLLRSAEPTAA